jgi:hypothetical protein
MAQRLDPISSLDFFPTPPWATRALFAFVDGGIAWEPAAGEGHMAEVLKERFDGVIASDVHDYGVGYGVGSFVGHGPDVMGSSDVDWIVTNPPFNLALDFALRAVGVARRGVALLVRTTWLEGAERHARLFSRRPPTTIALFAERVAMTKGKWDPDASTATSYCWVIWRQDAAAALSELDWIPPGSKAALTKADDAARFARRARTKSIYYPPHADQCLGRDDPSSRSPATTASSPRARLRPS